jgi:hypothetical protein
MFKNLLVTVIPEAVPLDTFTGLSSPSKKAQAKREKQLKEAKAKLGDKYLNVPFKKGEPVEELPASVPRIGRKAKSA